MEQITLAFGTGHDRIDEVLRGIVGSFESAFPVRVRGYYVEGSYADASALATSDIDIIIVFKDALAAQEQQRAEQLVAHCAALSSVTLDIDLIEEHSLAGGAVPMFKLASVCIYGEDIRERLSLLPIDAWTNQRMHAAYWLSNRVFERPIPVTLPIGFPDAGDPFRGYTRRMMRLANRQQVACTRDLLRVTGWMATALLAYSAQQYVARKRDLPQLYRTHIGDEWSLLLEDLSRWCRDVWAYRVPADRLGREQLAALCERTLAFENHFLMIYRDFMLNELCAGSDARRRHAMWVLERVPLRDQQIAVALRELNYI